jgi:glutaredoxin
LVAVLMCHGASPIEFTRRMGEAPMPRMRVTLYSKPGCHLCDDAKEVIDRVRAKQPFDLVIKDIGENAQDFAQYQYAIPVILLDDREIARYRLTEDQLERALAG